jgi:hypothetical protein
MKVFPWAGETQILNGARRWDHELHCKQDMRCWNSLKPLERPYMDFLNLFADTLHQHNLKLSVFIAGCCGFVDPAHDRSRVTGCVGAESNHDFCGTHCADFSNSSVDRVIAGATYSGSWHDDQATGRRETWALQSLAAAGKQAIGVPRYGTGLKGGFGPPVANASLPNCSQPVPPLRCYGPFDDAGRAVIDALHDMGIVHMAKFMDEPRTEQEWQAWGYHLHGPQKTDDVSVQLTAGGQALATIVVPKGKNETSWWGPSTTCNGVHQAAEELSHYISQMGGTPPLAIVADSGRVPTATPATICRGLRKKGASCAIDNGPPHQWCLNEVGTAHLPRTRSAWQQVGSELIGSPVLKSDPVVPLPSKSDDDGTPRDLSSVIGANYNPSYAKNDVMTWLDYNSTLVRQELGWAGANGINAVRVFLHYLAWQHDDALFLSRVEDLCAAAGAADVKVLFVIFDSDFSNATYNESWVTSTEYRDSWWVPNPGMALVDAGPGSAAWLRLEEFVTQLVRAHKDDERVLGYDIMNEPHYWNPMITPFIAHWANVISALDSLHFTCSGGSSPVPNTEGLENLTALTYHVYTSAGDGAVAAGNVAAAQELGASLHKPTMLTETMRRYPPRNDSLYDVLRSVNGCAAGAKLEGFFVWELMLGSDQFTRNWAHPFTGLLYPASAGDKAGTWRFPAEQALWETYGRTRKCPPAKDETAVAGLALKMDDGGIRGFVLRARKARKTDDARASVDDDHLRIMMSYGGYTREGLPGPSFATAVRPIGRRNDPNNATGPDIFCNLTCGLGFCSNPKVTQGGKVKVVLDLHGAFTSSPGIFDRGHCRLFPGWEADLKLFVAAATPHVDSGCVSGIFLGDELVCGGLPYADLATVAAQLKSELPHAWLYTNECAEMQSWPPIDRWGNGGVPLGLDAISVDFYDEENRNGAEEVSKNRHFYEEVIFPRLRPWQKALFVPGIFASSPVNCKAHGVSCPLDAQAAQIVAKLGGFFQWARNDSRVIGFNGWHFSNRTSKQYGGAYDQRLGAESMPTVVAKLAEIAGYIDRLPWVPPPPHPPPPPPSPPPPPPLVCTVSETSQLFGCFNDSGECTNLLSVDAHQHHDHVTQENCASLCFADNLTMAGIDQGNHCCCGNTVAGASQRRRPMAECEDQKWRCTGNHSQFCGSVGRMLAFKFHCVQPPTRSRSRLR